MEFENRLKTPHRARCFACGSTIFEKDEISIWKTHEGERLWAVHFECDDERPKKLSN